MNFQSILYCLFQDKPCFEVSAAASVGELIFDNTFFENKPCFEVWAAPSVGKSIFETNMFQNNPCFEVWAAPLVGNLIFENRVFQNKPCFDVWAAPLVGEYIFKNQHIKKLRNTLRAWWLGGNPVDGCVYTLQFVFYRKSAAALP